MTEMIEIFAINKNMIEKQFELARKLIEETEQ